LRQGERVTDLSHEERGSGDPVVLLHGGMLTRHLWDAEFDLLAATHRVIRYDARAHGSSPTPTEPFSHADDLLGLLDVLGVARASLVGLSMGARTSIDFAIKNPHRVKTLLLVGPGISGMTHRDPFILEHMAKLGSVTSADEAAELVTRMWVDGPHRAPSDVDPAVRERCRAMKATNLARHGGAWFVLQRELGAVDRVPELTARTLALVGDLDSSDIHDVADLVARSAPRARKELVRGAGHVINLDQPAAFRRLMLDFLAE
jgi:3-oxoadipate enol-lactonase